MSGVTNAVERPIDDVIAELRDADRSKDEFLATLAHKLRNQLAALRGAAELVRLRAPASGDLEQPQLVLQRQIQQMTRLIDDLLDVSLVTRNRLTIQTERVELRRILASALEHIQPTIDQRCHAVTLELPTDPVWLEGDAGRLAQVFANLLDNAAKYTQPGGRIRLCAEKRAGHLVVEVEDSGIGIEADLLPHVFDLFRQARSTPDPGFGGLGVGLTLVKRLVELHQGTVIAQSAGQGQGCTFIVQLPLPDDDGRTSGAADER